MFRKLRRKSNIQILKNKQNFLLVLTCLVIYARLLYFYSFVTHDHRERVNISVARHFQQNSVEWCSKADVRFCFHSFRVTSIVVSALLWIPRILSVHQRQNVEQFIWINTRCFMHNTDLILILTLVEGDRQNKITAKGHKMFKMW